MIIMGPANSIYKGTDHPWLLMTTLAMIFSWSSFVHSTILDGEQHRHLRSTINSNSNIPIITYDDDDDDDGISRKLQEEQQTTTTCILVTTGTGTFDGGYLDVSVNNGDGYNMVTTPGVNYVKGQVVLDECYVGLQGVQVTNTETNAWAGSIESSFNSKGSPYSAMTCLNCTGAVETTELIVVDGDDNGIGDTKCLNGSIGNVCTLISTGTSSLEPSKSPVTEIPTSSPSDSPALPQLETVGSDGNPVEVYPLGRCQSDCDNDDDCEV